MKDKFTVDFNGLAKTLSPRKTYRLEDVKDRIEKVGFNLVRFPDNSDTDQLWRVQETDEGPVIVALYGDNGGLVVESEEDEKRDWEAVPDKTSMNVFYKGEHLLSLSSQDLGIPTDEFSTLRRWLPRKLETDTDLQKNILQKVPTASRRLISSRFPELAKVAMCDVDDDAAAVDSFDPMEPTMTVEDMAVKIKSEFAPEDIRRLIDLLREEQVV